MNKPVQPLAGPVPDEIGKGTAATAAPPASANASAPERVELPKVEVEKERTPGLKAFDFLLYPVLTNVGVFTLSVAATYLTTRGGDRNAAGKLIYGKFGDFFHKRGEWMVKKFTGMGMNHAQADMSKMVFFSFLDGSLMAPFVKMFEDRREKIACAIDHQLGTKPDDMSVYREEPKQTWLSVLGGRLATVAIVVPTAVMLDKTGLNNTLFNKSGLKLGEKLAEKAWVKNIASHLDVKELTRIGLFEAFYTSVCTGGLYLSSRFIAKHTNKEAQAKAKAEKANVIPCTTEALAPLSGTPVCAPTHVEPDHEPRTDHAASVKRPRSIIKPVDIKPTASFREYIDETSKSVPALAV